MAMCLTLSITSRTRDTAKVGLGGSVVKCPPTQLPAIQGMTPNPLICQTSQVNPTSKQLLTLSRSPETKSRSSLIPQYNSRMRSYFNSLFTHFSKPLPSLHILSLTQHHSSLRTALLTCMHSVTLCTSNTHSNC